MPIVILVGYWLIFWRKFLVNPYLLSTSELASTFFPYWIWMGRKWQSTESIYYRYPASIPFLSMFYPLSYIASKLTKFLSIDMSFRYYTLFILLHYLLASLISYKVMGLFGAITLTYAGYCIKPQTPCFVFTMAWMPGMLIGGPLGWISCAMAILGGYWPILVYFFPLAVLINPTCLFGVLLALPQIITFLWYWPKSVRCGQIIDRSLGRLSWTDLKYLFIPRRSTGLTNGVHYPETEMYMGIAVLFIWHWSWWWIPYILAILLLVGILPPIQRIPCRSIYLLTISLSFLSSGYSNLINTLLQALILLRNSSIYPSCPFSQWWDKPSRLYRNHPYNGSWPHVTGYLKEQRISDYHGAFSLKN